MNRNIVYALMAAILFGASTPFAKLLVGEVSPILLGGLLYLGSGIGLSIIRLIRDWSWKPSGLMPSEWPWLVGGILFGGVLGPVLLLLGLTVTSGSIASLLLNLEAVLTALIAWIVFRENADRRVVLGMIAIVAGGIVLSWPFGEDSSSNWLGAVAISAACFCWAIDNNLTRKVSATDALFVASSKGMIAGTVNTLFALSLGATAPNIVMLMKALSLGLAGYGMSLTLFVLALRGLGTARTGAYFSTAPFIGAAVALVALNEATSPAFWLASGLMGLGVLLHLTEHHLHEHTHLEITHAHRHVHDVHHQHAHDFEWDSNKPHVHFHRHAEITHKHPHYPDIHHRHDH
ncbi:DMT family transporter [Methylomonas sp. EFPC3]|uniref:DMT family transporter n=1 Tax=unclassified Methylomonas TaxID=2608980 RepID=UPI002417C5E3|nr:MULTISPECIES: DMT family transporter [unclassified Methylomonas]WFP50392.1 DMT family transporter [Methylomonas sp. EFPC3]WGS85079.1 DMT family transporter [Methylomonas sp. UP202]